MSAATTLQQSQEELRTMATLIQGILIFLAAVVGILSYLLRAQLNAKAVVDLENRKLKEERRRRTLEHVEEQSKLFVGPMMLLYYQSSWAAVLSDVKTKKDDRFPMFKDCLDYNLLLESNDTNHMMITKYCQHYFDPTCHDFKEIYHNILKRNSTLISSFKKQIELIEKYVYHYGMSPTKQEMEKLYPKSIYRDDPLSMFSAYTVWLKIWVNFFETWDGTSDIKEMQDASNGMWQKPYIAYLLEWMW